MVNDEPMIITISHAGKKVIAELPWDSTMTDVAQALKGLLVATDWSVDLVNEYIKTDET